MAPVFINQEVDSKTGHTLPTRPEAAWQKMAQSALNDTTQPVNGEEEGRSSTIDRQWLTKKKGELGATPVVSDYQFGGFFNLKTGLSLVPSGHERCDAQHRKLPQTIYSFKSHSPTHHSSFVF